MKKCLSVMFAIAVAVALLGTAAVSFAAYDVWDGTTATSFAGGEGTENSPYLISNGAQLALLREIVNAYDGTYDSLYKKVYGDRSEGMLVRPNGTAKTHKRLSGKYFKLTNDIDMNNTNFVKGIGWSNDKDIAYTFAGIFDGNGHIIKNFNLTGTSSSCASGLFGITEDATIENLGMEDAAVTVGHNGSIFGHSVLIGKAYGNLTLNNCYVRNSKVTNSAATTDETVGLGILTGTVGDDSLSDSGKYMISNCYAVNCEIGSQTENAKLKKVSAFGKTKGYNIEINNCYAANTEKNMGLKITNIQTIKDSSRTNYIFSCQADGTDAGNYTSKGQNCFVIGKKQSAVFYLKQGEAFYNVTADELKALPTGLNSESAYKKDVYGINGGYPILNWEYERVCNPYKVENPKYIKDGNVIQAPEAGATLSAADITKNTATAAGNGTAVFAFFDGNERLQAIKAVNFTNSDFNQSATATLTVNMELPGGDNFNNGKIKIFIFDSMSTLKPENRDVTVIR